MAPKSWNDLKARGLQNAEGRTQWVSGGSYGLRWLSNTTGRSLRPERTLCMAGRPPQSELRKGFALCAPTSGPACPREQCHSHCLG